MQNKLATPPPLDNGECPYVDKCPHETYFTNEQSHLNVSRQDKFLLVMDVPCILKPILQKENRFCHGGNLDRLQFSIWGYVVPDVTVEKIESTWAGQTFKFSSLARPSYPAVSVNFTVDNRYDNYFILWKWLDLQNYEDNGRFDGKEMGGESGHLPEYSTTMTIYALDEYNKEMAAWDFTGAFISTLGALNASYRETGEMESTFSFEFSQLKMRLL